MLCQVCRSRNKCIVSTLAPPDRGLANSVLTVHGREHDRACLHHAGRETGCRQVSQGNIRPHQQIGCDKIYCICGTLTWDFFTLVLPGLLGLLQHIGTWVYKTTEQTAKCALQTRMLSAGTSWRLCCQRQKAPAEATPAGPLPATAVRGRLALLTRGHLPQKGMLAAWLQVQYVAAVHRLRHNWRRQCTPIEWSHPSSARLHHVVSCHLHEHTATVKRQFRCNAHCDGIARLQYHQLQLMILTK
jgi:hypothetical protein